jgi:hypothetical protein
MLNKIIVILSWIVGITSVYLDAKTEYKIVAEVLFIVALLGFMYSYKINKD